ncbi:MAG: hypothetical protein JWO24_771 [Rhodospirillales bacterium]|jgi:hypothetical protein|nr:hypothetical protein [Rhodospirillales bacterium]
MGFLLPQWLGQRWGKWGRHLGAGLGTPSIIRAWEPQGPHQQSGGGDRNGRLAPAPHWSIALQTPFAGSGACIVIMLLRKMPAR